MTIIILSNTANPSYFYLLKDCIDSIDTNKYSVIVVETNSKLKGKNIPLNAKFIFPEEEFNYNKFINYGLSYTDDNKILISNNDVIFSPGCLQEIETKLDIYDSVCPQDVNTHNNILDDIEGTKVGYHVIGCCIAFTRKTLGTIGLFDPKFKFWYQDNDYCNNLKKHNLKHALLQNAKIKHLKMQSHILLNEKHYEMTHGIEPFLKEKWPEYD
jgi:hypothetical protein